MRTNCRIQEVWKKLLAGEKNATTHFVTTAGLSDVIAILLVIIIGSGVYGATLGIWRSPLQSIYAAIKFPIIILSTVTFTALLNGMSAQIIGLRIPFRQSSLAVLLSFAIVSALLASLSPVLLFFISQAPELDSPDRNIGHSITLLLHVLAIGSSGIAGNLRLHGLLCALSDRTMARRVLMFWLVANLFVGSQLSWICRPFVGSPGLPVEFVRADALDGSFYEIVWNAFLKIF